MISLNADKGYTISHKKLALSHSEPKLFEKETHKEEILLSKHDKHEGTSLYCRHQPKQN